MEQLRRIPVVSDDPDLIAKPDSVQTGESISDSTNEASMDNV